jgi:membrane-associated phospholipid phosphatase
LRRLALVACVAGLLLSPGAAGADAGSGAPARLAQPDAATAVAREDGRRTLRLLPLNLLRGTVGVFHGDNVVPLLVGSTATAAGSFLDDSVADSIADPEHDFGESLEDGAKPEVVGLVVAGVFTAGRLVEAPRFRAMSYDLLDAFIVNWAYTSVLKATVGRERPNVEDDESFPSGHASNAFALAAVAERHYGWKAGVPAYALASLVAVSRLQRNKHYLSDVMAGATLGYLVGRTVVRVNGGPVGLSKGTQVSLSPLVGRRTRGLAVSVGF